MAMGHKWLHLEWAPTTPRRKDWLKDWLKDLVQGPWYKDLVKGRLHRDITATRTG